MGGMYTNITLRGPTLDSVLAYLNAQAIVAYVAAPQGPYVVVYDQASESQEEAILTARTEQLSRQFECAALAALNHDDDILMYWLYEKGEQIDHYDSAPGYFTGRKRSPVGGNAATLCRVFGIDSSKANEIETILRASSDSTVPLSFSPGILFEPANFINNMDTFDERMTDWVRRLLGLESLDDKEGLEALIQRMQSTIDYSSAMDRHEALLKMLNLPDCTVGFGFDYLDRGDIPDGLSRDDLQLTGPIS